ncbi:MAG: GspH/FimT family pseudopilin [bacterium]
MMHKSDPYGFTLLELLWVLSILAILLSAIVPHFSGALSQMGLENKAREIYMALAYVQQQAVNRNATFGLSFDLTAGHQEVTCYRNIGYDAYGQPILDPNNVLRNPVTKKFYLIAVDQGEPSGDMRLTEADFGGNHWVEFNSLGEPNSQGRITLAGAGSSHAITVSQIGRLTFE